MEVAAIVDQPEIPGVVLAVREARAGGSGLVAVGGRGRAHDDHALLPGRRVGAVGALDPYLDPGQRPPRRLEQLRVREVVLGRGKHADDPRLAGSVGVGQDRAGALEQPAAQVGGRIRADVSYRHQRGQVATGQIRMVDQLDQAGFNQADMGDPLGLDRPQDLGWVEPLAEHDHPASENHLVGQHLRHVRERAAHQLAPIGRRADVDHPVIGTEAATARLGGAGGTPG